MTLMGIVREFTGPLWQPTEIDIMTDHKPCRYIREHFPNSRIRLCQPYSYITVENTLLSLPPPPHKASATASSPTHYDPLPDNFIDTLEQVMFSYIQEPDLSIDFAAFVFNTSTRTLQRTLTEMGTHNSELLSHARFRAACQMLLSPGLKVTDIAHRLGYSDLAHFSCAFRRIADVTPRAYRQQYIH